MLIDSDDLISREYLRDAFDNLCCHNCKTCRNFRNEDSFYKCGLIDNAPTVETSKIEYKAYNEGFKDGVDQGIKLSERPQGEWLHDSDRPDRLICSVCNCEWDMWRYESKELKYCPKCGADMRDKEI